MEETHKKANSISQLICFRLGQEEFGIDILKVREIVPVQIITRLPQTPDTVAGVINLRGEIIPVINLRMKFGIQQVDMTDKTRIIVVSISNKLIGMIVDRVERVVRMKEDQFELPPDIGVGKIQDYVIRIGKLEQSLVILLDIEKILTEEEILHIEDILKMKESFVRKEAKQGGGETEVVSPEKNEGDSKKNISRMPKQKRNK